MPIPTCAPAASLQTPPLPEPTSSVRQAALKQVWLAAADPPPNPQFTPARIQQAPFVPEALPRGHLCSDNHALCSQQ